MHIRMQPYIEIFLWFFLGVTLVITPPMKTGKGKNCCKISQDNKTILLFIPKQMLHSQAHFMCESLSASGKK